MTRKKPEKYEKIKKKNPKKDTQMCKYLYNASNFNIFKKVL